MPTARDYVDPGKLLMRKCTMPVGKREPRGDLFEHLKKDRPLPAPKAGTVAELPEPQEE
ncbi:hypothetical protein [Povalibacter sp.]|uniref:hypothetical protein n=1 Tax=Povalibacter sp. TaxID=1962978 RepID=UPI002F3E386F